MVDQQDNTHRGRRHVRVSRAASVHLPRPLLRPSFCLRHRHLPRSPLRCHLHHHPLRLQHERRKYEPSSTQVSLTSGILVHRIEHLVNRNGGLLESLV